MRLRELHLERFGHFTDRRFDFGTMNGRPDFHIIHGLNEAGKTTTMEAILRLFYGFPHREPYDFKHRRPNLRISAVIESEGASAHITRLPSRGGTLVDSSGTPLPETAMSAHLGGLTDNDYRSLLCLDDDTIERGGEEIAQARGDMGRLLFSAAAGVAELSTVLDAVLAEAGELWRKRASTTRLATLKRERAAVEKEIRGRDVTANAWRGLRTKLSDRRLEEAEARAALDNLRRDAAQLDARRRSLPRLAEFERLEGQIAPFADYPEQLDFDPERLVVLSQDDVRERANVERLASDIAELSKKRNIIRRMPELLKLSGKLDAIEDLRSRDATAGMDLDRRRATVVEQDAEMARAARDLDAAEGADPSALVLSLSEISRLETARDVFHRARDSAATEKREMAALTEQLAGAKADLERHVSRILPGQDPGEILARHDADSLAPAWAKAQQAIGAAEAGFRTSLDALQRGTVTFDALPDCPVTEAQARRRCEQFDAVARRIETAEETLEQQNETAAARAAEAGQLTFGGAVVSDAEAEALHDQRERLWHAHRRTLTAVSADHFEASMRQVDGMARTRLAQSRDLGQLRQIEKAQAEAEARVKVVAKRLGSLCEQRDALLAEIDASASAIGLPTPLPPGDWSDWIAARAAADAERRVLKRIRSTHASTLERAARLLEDLRPLVGLADPEFDAALSRARDLAKTTRQQLDAASQAKARCGQLEADLATRRSRLEETQEAAGRAIRGWETIVTDLLRGQVAPATLEASLDPLRSMREAEATRANAARRVRTMEEDRRRFAAEVADLAAAHDLPEAETPAETFTELRAQARAAEEAEAVFKRYTKDIESAESHRRNCRTRLDEIASEQQTLGRIFPDRTDVGTIQGLRKAAAVAQQVNSDRARRADLESALLSELSAPDLEAARTLLDGADHASLEAEANSLVTDLKTADAALTRATEARVAAEQALSQVTGDTGVAALTERRTSLDLQMEEYILRHLELRLGHRLADEAIRRYRDAHRSGMMDATERSFAALTRGAYTQLKSQPERDGEILLAVDTEDTAKRVAEMSKSTRFQLYLALRAAAHEQLVTQGICLPFFCDDIFETFDEERTSAACRVMEQISRAGQAIYLTHHRHVLDIAETVCDTAPMVHEL